MSDYFDDLLTIIFDADRPLNPSRLSELSDPTLSNVAAFRRAWFNTDLERRREISMHLHQLAQENIELLFERINLVLLEDPDPRIREQAIENLWETEEPMLAQALATMSKDDPDASVRSRAAKALARFVYLGEMDKLPAPVLQQVQGVLHELLGETSPMHLQRQALESLGYSSKVDLKEHIERAYNSGDEARIQSSLVAMGRTADQQWREQIETHINHASPGIRAEAARAIGEIQSRRSAALLLDLLDDPKEEVRKAAIWSLGQVGGDPARKALERLSEQETSAEISAVIEEALEYIAFLDATPDLMMFDIEADE